MKFRRVQRRYSFWVAIIVIIIAISLVGIWFQHIGDSSLDAHTGTNVINEATEETDVKSHLITKKSNRINCSVGIPYEWTAVTKNGYETWVHKSGTAVQLQITDFEPNCINATQGSEQTQLNIDGYQLVSFSWVDNTSYAEAYQNEDFAFMRLVSFDKKHTLKAVITIPIDMYQYMQDIATDIFDSIKWEKEYPFSTDVLLQYNKNANFYYGIPSSWQFEIGENTTVAQDNDTGTVISVSYTQTTDTFDKTTNVDYSTIASQGRMSYNLNDFQKDKKSIKAISTYYSGNEEMILYQYLIATGQFQYNITIEAKATYANDINKIFETEIDTIKYFPTTKKSKSNQSNKGD